MGGRNRIGPHRGAVELLTTRTGHAYGLEGRLPEVAHAAVQVAKGPDLRKDGSIQMHAGAMEGRVVLVCFRHLRRTAWAGEVYRACGDAWKARKLHHSANVLRLVLTNPCRWRRPGRVLVPG